jgi:hypothetical protein
MYRVKCVVVDILTVTGIFFFFCTVIRISATVTPFLNDIRIHEGLVLHVIPVLHARSASLSTHTSEDVISSNATLGAEGVRKW